MLSELLQLNLFAFFLIFARVGTAFSLLPGFSAVYVPIQARLVLGLAVSLVLTPGLMADLPVLPAAPMAVVLLLLGEFIIGAFLASIARFMVAALQIAGTFMSYFASIANALVQDPVAEQQSSTIALFLSTLGLVAVFAADLHHLMIRSLADSYVLFPAGEVPMLGDMADSMARRLAEAFSLALRMAAPMLLVAITYYIGLGVLSRLMPQLQVFFFGLPFQITVQFWVMMLALSGMMMAFLSHFAEGYGPFVAF